MARAYFSIEAKRKPQTTPPTGRILGRCRLTALDKLIATIGHLILCKVGANQRS